MGLWSGAYYSHSSYSNMNTIIISLLNSVIETGKIYLYLSIMFILTKGTKTYEYLGWQTTQDHIVAKLLSVYYLLLGSSSSNSYQFCRDRLDKQGFWKHNTVRGWETRHQNSVKREDQGTNTAPRWRCWNWIQVSFIILSAMKERICRELSYNSCGLQGQRTKWSLTNE